MKIEKDRVALIQYCLTDETGEKLESTFDEDHPLAYLHGHANVFALVEQALEGLEPGDKKEITVPAADAYGEYVEGAEDRVSKKHLVDRVPRIAPGEIISVNTENGPMHARIKKVGKFMVTVDMNHPYAGKTLTYNMEVVDVREATQEEIAQGHARSDAGHKR